MAAQPITFDFLTTGADRTAAGFRKVGDNTLLAAKGAKVLADAIEKLGAKEDRTAAESKVLASALRQTGDAEDRVAAKAVLADAAIRRLDDAMQDSTKKSGDLKKALGDLKLNPGLLGPAIALAPALGTLTGVVAGAAAGLGGAFIAGGAALAAFGAVAKPVLTDAKTAAAAVEKAQNNYNAAIAGGTKQSVAYKAEQAAIAKAYAGMSPAQIALSKQLGTMADAWDKVKAAQTPVVAGALQPWLKSVTGLTSALGPIIAKIAPVIQGLGTQFGALVNSSAFTQFRDFIGSTGAAAVSAGGSTIIDLIKSFITLLPKFDPLIREAVGWISRLGPAVLKWSSSKKASDDITKFLQWFSTNGPVVGKFLTSIGAALAALAPGLAAGGALELKVITDFLNFVAKLPPSIAKPLAEVAGALLILNKLGVVSVGVKLLGLGGAGGAAAGLGAAAGGAAAGGLWSKILPGARLVGGALVISLIIDQALQNKKNDKVLGNTNPNAPWNSFTSSQSLGGLAIRGIESLFARETVSADKATAKIRADFAVQGKAATAAEADVGILTNAITHNGNASGEAHSARATLIADMVKAGVNAATAQADVVRYSNAVTANGTNSDQARAARQRLITDILNASGNARKGNTDLSTYTQAVKDHGTKSDQARAARLRLIQDLVNGGTDAKTATGLVDGLGTSIGKLPSGKNIKITMDGQGNFVIKGSDGKNYSITPGGFLSPHAAGGLITGGTPGRDSVLAAVMPGEVIVPTRMVAAGAVDHLRGRLPGFGAGGAVPGYADGGKVAPRWDLTPEYVAGALSGFEGLMSRSMEAFIRAGVKTADAAVAAARAAQAAAGNIPYLGTTLPPIGTMIKYFGPLGDPSREAGVSFAGHPVQINQVLAGNLSRAGGQVAAAGFSNYIRDVGGFRTSKGASGSPIPYSMHQFGAAIDINEDGGPNGNWNTMTLPAKLVSIMAANQWFCGQNWGGASRDGGHFQFTGGGGNPFAGITGVPSGGPIGAGAAAAQAFARSILWAYGWTMDQFPSLQALWNGESGWRWNANNPSSGAYGIPQSLPASKMASAGADWLTNPATQIRWGLGYIKSTYGSPANAYSRWLGRSPHWYSEGGLVGVPGYATGGSVAGPGQTYLNAWRSRRGGPYALAVGPRTLTQQIPAMQAAIGRATTLSRAGGLSAGQHKFWANAAAGEKRLLATLNKEMTTEKAWSGQLGGQNAALAREIAAAGTLPSLAGNVRSWKAQMAAHLHTIGDIRGMIGAVAAPGTPGGPALPKVTHVYGGDIANTIAPVLASALGPFTGAARGGMVFDRGGTLAPGFNPVWNNTGRPESLIPARGGAGGRLQIEWVGGSGGDDLERWIRKNVRIRGGTGPGAVDRAYGSR